MTDKGLLINRMCKYTTFTHVLPLIRVLDRFSKLCELDKLTLNAHIDHLRNFKSFKTKIKSYKDRLENIKIEMDKCYLDDPTLIALYLEGMDLCITAQHLFRNSFTRSIRPLLENVLDKRGPDYLPKARVMVEHLVAGMERWIKGYEAMIRRFGIHLDWMMHMGTFGYDLHKAMCTFVNSLKSDVTKYQLFLDAKMDEKFRLQSILTEFDTSCNRFIRMSSWIKKEMEEFSKLKV